MSKTFYRKINDRIKNNNTCCKKDNAAIKDRLKKNLQKELKDIAWNKKTNSWEEVVN